MSRDSCLLSNWLHRGTFGLHAPMHTVTAFNCASAHAVWCVFLMLHTACFLPVKCRVVPHQQYHMREISRVQKYSDANSKFAIAIVLVWIMHPLFHKVVLPTAPVYFFHTMVWYGMGTFVSSPVFWCKRYKVPKFSDCHWRHSWCAASIGNHYNSWFDVVYLCWKLFVERLYDVRATVDFLICNDFVNRNHVLRLSNHLHNELLGLLTQNTRCMKSSHGWNNQIHH